MKTFCIAGPVVATDHYFISHRLDRDTKIHQLLEEKKYFILHAPRQSGKTTGLLELVKILNDGGVYKALYVNVEVAQASRGKYLEGLRGILDQLEESIQNTFGQNDAGYLYLKEFSKSGDVSSSELFNFLTFWSRNSTKPIVLFIDEIDSLVGDTLISVLRQIRTGYTNRPILFPQSICLVGVRDVRDYRIWSDDQHAMVLGGSAFNIKAASLLLGNFTQQEVRDLYEQHTADTGQKFTDEAIEHAFYLTQGQPWLVNALAYEACFVDVKDRSQSITKEVIERAKETLIKRRDTHIDVLSDRLREPRVRAIIEALIVGSSAPLDFPDDDIQYVMDLGLISRRETLLTIANPMYQEIFPRSLVASTQRTISEQTAWYVRPDGSLDMDKLLEAYAQFFRENSDAWLEKFDYKEAGPHLLLMAFLQRIINGGGTIHREYALGRRRVDLFITWKTQRIVVETKLWYGEKTLKDGLQQTADYMDMNKATEGHLVIFDRRSTATWDEKIYRRQELVGDKKITVWGM